MNDSLFQPLGLMTHSPSGATLITNHTEPQAA